MSAKEHLSFFARVKGIKDVKRNVEHVMARLNLTPRADTLASKLSGGNKRKLSLAIALMGKPPVLVLDEPTSAMDAVAKRAFWRIVQEISPGRSLIITVSHLSHTHTYMYIYIHLHTHTHTRNTLSPPFPLNQHNANP